METITPKVLFAKIPNATQRPSGDNCKPSTWIFSPGVANGINMAKNTNGISISIRLARVLNLSRANRTMDSKITKYAKKTCISRAGVATTTKIKHSAPTTFKCAGRSCIFVCSWM
jgi:hypothetical protein